MTTATNADEDLITAPEAAEILGVHRQTVWRKLNAGDIRDARLVGRNWVIPRSSLAEHLNLSD